MKVISQISKEKIKKSFKEEAKRKFTVCNPDRCPRCRISDG